MIPLTTTWIRDVLQSGSAAETEHAVDAICTDSRTAGPTTLFFALKGERTDGHAYVPAVLEKGACVVVDPALVPANILDTFASQIIEVASPIKALGALAAAYRRTYLRHVHIIGVTGSVGKTSTREMIASILKTTHAQVASSQKNYNNEIGVPLTLFNMPTETEIGVVEMGMRAEGEIRDLAMIALPDTAVITGIGFAHIEILGSQEAIARAKSEILELLPEGGTAIFSEDIPYRSLVEARIPAHARTLITGKTTGELWAETSVNSPLDLTEFMLCRKQGSERVLVRIPAAGTHHMKNAEIAAGACAALRTTLAKCAEALSTWQGAEGRMAVKTAINGAIVLDDCYNASPESMWAAIRTLCSASVQTAGKRIAVIGDMRELGDFGHTLHSQLGDLIAASPIDTLVTIGDLAGEAANIAHAASNGRLQPVRTSNWQECAALLPTLVSPADTVLIKGSRALELEHVVAALTGEECSAHG